MDALESLKQEPELFEWVRKHKNVGTLEKDDLYYESKQMWKDDKIDIACPALERFKESLSEEDRLKHPLVQEFMFLRFRDQVKEIFLAKLRNFTMEDFLAYKTE